MIIEKFRLYDHNGFVEKKRYFTERKRWKVNCVNGFRYNWFPNVFGELNKEKEKVIKVRVVWKRKREDVTEILVVVFFYLS